MPLSSTNAAQSIVRPGVCTSATKPASPFDGQMIYMSDVDQSAVWDGSTWVGLDPSRDRNVVINGAMQIAQRGTSTASITGGGYFTGDRWATNLTSLGTWTQSVENDAPTGSGFRKSLKMLCTTADASPASGDELAVGQLIEGQNLQHFCKGTSSAKQFVLSFWVKANVTGTYIVWLYDPDNNRETSLSYQVSSSATWEKKTLIFAADTTGAFDNDNAVSLYVRFYLGAGSSLTSGSLSTTWATVTTANRAVGQTNLASATNNYWQVTGVQLEAGAVATPFEFEDIGTTLRKCQRYYQKSYSLPTNPGTATSDGIIYFTSSSNPGGDFVMRVELRVEMRTGPSVSLWNNGGGSGTWTYTRSGVTETATTVNSAWHTTNGFGVYGGVGASYVVCQAYGHYAASAEL